MLYRITLFVLLATGLHAQQVSTLVEAQSGIGYEAVNWNPTNGRIVIPDFYNNQVHEVFLDGSRNVLLTDISGPLGGAWDAAGNFYVSEYYGAGKIFRIAPDGTSTELATGLGGPAGLLVDEAAQIIYAADYDGDVLYRVSLTDGAVDTLAHGNGLNGPDCIVFDPDGNLIVNNFDDNKIHRISLDGEVTLFSTLFGSPNSGYLVRRGDEYLVAGFASNRLWRVDSTGTAVAWTGSSVSGHVNGSLEEARFARPNGISMSADRDSLVVSDGLTNQRIRLITGLNDTVSGLFDGPTGTDLSMRVFPNPATERVELSYVADGVGAARVSVFSMEGVEVKVLRDSTQTTGKQQLEWIVPAELPNGYYQMVVQTKEAIGAVPVLVYRK